MLDVEKVEFDTLLQLHRMFGSSTISANLRPSGDARANAVPMRVLLSALMARQILCAHPDRQRPRPNQRHLTAEHIEQLWELVKARSTQKPPKRSYATIVSLRLASASWVA